MHRGAAEAPFPHRHLLGIEGLSPDDINHVLDLADGYVELNRQAEKKRSLLRGRTIINCFFESSTRIRKLAGDECRALGVEFPFGKILT
jgi:aspartate carbamoyltransferase catalytic subunit